MTRGLRRKERQLLVAVRSGDVDTVRKLLADGHSPNVAARRPGTSPLHEAVRRGDLPMVKTLVAAGAAPDVADRCGDFPLDLAIHDDHDDIARFLRDLGARRHDEDDLSVPGSPMTAELSRVFEAARRDEWLAGVDTGAFRRLAPRRKKPPSPRR